jgi:hypothetical protein
LVLLHGSRRCVPLADQPAAIIHRAKQLHLAWRCHSSMRCNRKCACSFALSRQARLALALTTEPVVSLCRRTCR